MASGPKAGAFVLYDEHLEKMPEASGKRQVEQTFGEIAWLRLSLDKFLEA